MKDRSYLEENGVDVQTGLDLLGDMDMYNETMEDFLNEINEKYPKAKEYKEAGDMPNYAILVHSIKSDSKYLGFTKLAEMSYDHEMAGKNKDKAFADQHVRELLTEANRIIGVVKQYLGV